MTPAWKSCACLLACAGGLAVRAVTVECGLDDKAARFAANELEQYLKDVKGRISIVEDAGLQSQEWRINALDGHVTISGCDGMGAAYGVYTFLEKHLGFRWYAPDTAHLPDIGGRSLKVLKIDERSRPAIIEREMYVGTDYMDPYWRLRNKETRRANFGVGVASGTPRDCHTFGWYAKSINLKDNPAAAGVDAKGKPTGMFCPSSPDARRLVAGQMMRAIRGDREKCKAAGMPAYAWPTIYELSQDDGGVWDACLCSRCKAQYAASGSWSGMNIAFVSEVAKIVGEEFPDVVVRTFAYSYTELPPTNAIRAADNVSARYCRSFVFQPLTRETDCGRTLVAWDKHVVKKHIWSYWRSFSGPLFPMVKPRRDIQDEMRFCRDMNVYGYFAQNEAPLSRSFAMMQHWLFLKLAEDPERDAFALSDEFIRAYYGKAAKPISKYLDYLEKRQTECHAKIDRAFLRGVHSGNLAQYVQRAYLDADFFRVANALLDKAERLAAGDAAAALHVGHERLVVDRAMRSMAFQLSRQGYKPDWGAAAKRAEKTLPRLVGGWCGLKGENRERWLNAVKREISAWKSAIAPLPHELTGRDVWVWDAAAIAGGFEWDIVVDDAAAMYGTAVRFPAGNQKFDPPRFFAGAYDALGRDGCELKLESGQIPADGKYHLLRLGTIRVLSPAYVYFNSWHYRTWLPTIGIEPEKREIWISAKFDGPAFVPGSSAENSISYDGMFIVKIEADK